MDNSFLVLITILFVAVLAIILVIYFIRSKKRNRIKRRLEELEVEKNKIDSSPIIPELAKVEAYLKNTKVKKMYNEWSERLKFIKEKEIPEITDMILETEYSLDKKDYKATIYNISKLEMKLYKVRTNSEFLLGEIKEITSSEERSRVVITEYKVKYRELLHKFQSSKNEYGKLEATISKQFEVIAKRFEDYETIMDNNEYTEVNNILKIIDDLLKHMSIVIDEVPSIILISTSVLPRKIREIDDVYNKMLKANYPLEYLNVEYNIKEAEQKIKDIKARTKDLNLEDSLFELKVLLDYFESLYNDFENEKLARAKYSDNVILFRNKLKKINDVVEDIFEQLDDLKNVYNLSESSIELLKQIYDELQVMNNDYVALLEHANRNSIAFTKLLKELEVLSTKLATLEDNLDTTLDSLGNMRDDEIRARQQLEEIKVVLKDAKLKMREYNLPVIPQSYYIELNEASSAIREIIKELDRKPITISVLNTRVDTARDLVLKLYTKTRELLKTAAFAELAIVYGNRYRSSYDGLSNKLNLTEQLFLKGEYKKSLEMTINLLNRIEPGLYDRLLKLYNPKNEEEVDDYE